MKPRATTLLAGLSLMIPAAFAFSAGVPTLLMPLPGIVVIPAFLLGIPAVFVPSLFFFVWNPGLLSGKENVPKRTLFLFLSLILLTPVWFALGWRFGLQFQGPHYTYALCAINAIWILVLGAQFIVHRNRQPSFAWNLALHWGLFAWLAWFAFPYLGELP